ncbi:Coenzyme F420 hydrogenase/dehydrogenase, beta subunit C-terminal domain [Sphingomonas sp. KRR8]|uniref:Coenzyme F420 hydrogenase/dehydrogenase, beta subunit C-terminal domain n=1 Tax=Sphingomonas sp. KRR8 TaxID=2942996 RepID=UPI002021925E|nr:Coenzyme F420 hydrogenase/dehydrogenase, beta subunit C-terminal domain [Sphingomonas sp. KRR8]URD61507.1 Coenzyme F420 hydrogenase/dehydrogenase, beta subunit C-terminal domain [Sphingomonas sp. KRR8]
MRWNRFRQLEPHGSVDWFEQPSTDVARRCPFSPAAANENIIADERFPAVPRDERLGALTGCFVGHVTEPGFRNNGSSGGLVSWVAAELLRTGAVDAVAHVAPTQPDSGGFFAYGLSHSVEELFAGAKSRYHPVELSGILRTIRAKPGRYAIVGIPCFIKAVHLARKAEPSLAERITHTLGLFCGHMKSARFVESFAWQLHTPMPEVRAVDYRVKDEGRPANWYRAQLTLADGSQRAEDWWRLADGDWGAGFFQSEACNWCDDVAAETADVAFGDAWVEPYSSDGRGTNVVVTRNAEMLAMLKAGSADGRLALTPVDADFVADTQAAGFRHRHEGLAYRLGWRSTRRKPVQPRKRVAPGGSSLPLRRKLVYRTRAAIARWSHRLSWAAHRLDWPALYLRPARAGLALYGALAWGHGRLGKVADRWLGAARR